MSEPHDLERLFARDTVTPKDDQIARLTKALVSEREARREDWFLFILLGLIVIDIWTFLNMDVWTGPLVVLVLQALLLLLLARRYGIDDVTVFLDKILHTARSITGKSDDS